MNKKLLCAALLGSLGMAQVASAQSWDDRWYISGSAGINFQDEDRDTGDAAFGTLGFGKFLNPNFSLETELNYQNPEKNSNRHLWWSQYGISVDGRYHFRTVDARWWPYLRGGVGWQRHEEEYNDGFNRPDSFRQHEASNLALNLGAGLQFDLGRVDIRTEIGGRVDFDDEQARLGPQENSFVDLLASIGLTVALGPEPVVAVMPAPVAAPTCADMDDDGDGVNNCDDRCPGSQAGETIGPDGCPVPVAEPEPVLEAKPFRG